MKRRIGKASPLLERRGGCATKKMLRSLRSGADGVVTHDETLLVSDHPALRAPLLSRRGLSLMTFTLFFVIGAAAQGGQRTIWDGVFNEDLLEGQLSASYY